MGLFKPSLLLTLLAVSIRQTLGQYRQSPINIVTDDLQDIHLAPLIFYQGYGVEPDAIKMSVDNYTITLTFDQSITPVIYGGPLNTKYMLHSVHFHWGSNNSMGSEHRFNGKMDPMEIHAVHVKNGMDIEEAKKLRDGIAVVAYTVEVSPTRFVKNDLNFAYFELITENFASLEHINHEITLPRVLPLNHIIEKFFYEYVTYAGSLTTPNFDEAVIWLISTSSVYITQDQLDAFRGLLDQGLIQSNDNWREPQPLHDRGVFYAESRYMKNAVMDKEYYNLFDSLHLKNHLDDDLAHEKKP